MGLDRVRFCNGGPNARVRCGARACFMVTEAGGGIHPMQWFACDNRDHHEGGSVESLGDWFARLDTLLERQP